MSHYTYILTALPSKYLFHALFLVAYFAHPFVVLLDLANLERDTLVTTKNLLLRHDSSEMGYMNWTDMMAIRNELVDEGILFTLY